MCIRPLVTPEESGEGDGALLRGLGLSRPDGHDAMAVLAHPDDETIGLGGQLAALGHLTIVHATDGAPRDMQDARAHGFARREDYAAARRRELEAAMAVAGIAPEALIGLGLVDQEAARQMPDLARRLATLFSQRRTGVVFTHAYEGGHPDHDSVCLAVHAAAGLMTRQGLRPPVLVDMPLYHLGASGMVAQSFAPHPAVPHLALRLDDAAWSVKQRMLALHDTQQGTLAAFCGRTEQFRRAPTYDFTILPNGGNLYYERFSWGLDGAAWLRLTRQALDALGLAT